MGAKISEQQAISEGWYKPNTNHGYCMCGCGEKAKIARGTRKPEGTVIGYPKRFLKGHFSPFEKALRHSNGDQQCKECKVVKPISEFPWVSDGDSGYHRGRCDLCTAQRYANYHYLKTFGLSLDKYNILLESQGGVCAICGKKENGKRHAVDHDHKTQQIRGLLCAKCNQALGLFEDDPDLLVTAATYLLTRSG